MCKRESEREKGPRVGVGGVGAARSIPVQRITLKSMSAQSR